MKEELKHHHHHEGHKGSSERIRDLIIGMSDGLTVPFALAAGLSGVNIGTDLIVTAGLAEIAAGSIAMALGGYLSAQTEKEHYQSEYAREEMEIEIFPDTERQETIEILEEFGVGKKEVPAILKGLTSNKKRWVEFMMRFELGLLKPKKDRIYISPLIIGSAYIVGGLIPLAPYMLNADIKTALYESCLITGLALAIFGFVKGALTGVNKLKSLIQTTLVGGLAASTAYAVASLFGH